MRLPNGERPHSATANGYLPKAWGSPPDITRGPEAGPASRFNRTAAEQLQYELRQTGVALQEAHAQLVDEKEATLLAQSLERMAAAEAQKAHALVEKAARERELAGAKFAQQMSEQRKCAPWPPLARRAPLAWAQPRCPGPHLPDSARTPPRELLLRLLCLLRHAMR